MIAILDYGAGNLRSVENALAEIGCSYALARHAETLRAAAKILLPGVGHYGQMMRALDSLDLRGVLMERISAGVPFLGICLGLQALFECSEEAPDVSGLGLYPGMVRRFPANARVPHMGWNQLDVRPASRLFRGLAVAPYVYFAHSFYVPPDERASALCTYEVPYTAALECGNVFGVQFHPEKSAAAGLQLVRNFVELPC
jgi:imidazole glycerol-phosphate synthase subunit HisH